MTDRNDATVQFMRASFDGFMAGRGTYHVSWLGHETIKYPTDLIMYQELICRRRPALIVETGSFKGGSALFLASVCDLIGVGEVISIDVRNDERRAVLPVHPRITFLAGSSTAPEMVQAVHDRAASLGPDAEVMVILDSDHRLLHVLAELEAYAGLVRPGGYLIVEDGHVNGRPNWPDYGPGPSEAIAFFLPRHPEFEVDPACERFMMTLNPGGYLRRRDDPA